jgi:hypothetical protein
MKTIVLSLLLGLSAFVQSASALIISIDTTDANTFALDVYWGFYPWHPPYGYIYPPFSATDSDDHIDIGPIVLGPPNVVVNSAIHIVFSGPPRPISSGDYPGPSRDFAYASFIYDGTIPSRVTPITSYPFPYGAHIIYGDIPQNPPSNCVPEGGSTAALLGLAMIGCFGCRKFM